MEDIFFCIYNLRISKSECCKLSINERKWLMHKFVQQKTKEHESFEAERRKAKKK